LDSPSPFHLAPFPLLVCALLAPIVAAQADKRPISYSDARPIFDALRADLLPPELREATPAARDAAWDRWVSRRDAAIRARVEIGDDDSVINFLTYGSTFTRQPRIAEQELAGLVIRSGDSRSPVFVPSPVLLGRIEDFVAALASPGADERLQFARQILIRKGMDPATEAGRKQLRGYLQERAAVVGSAERSSRLLDPGTDLVDKLTIFRDRGLSSDTSISIDLGIEQALDAMKAAGVLRPGTIRRVALVGPGLDFVDKQNGYDFYPLQTIQPFALIDSLLRLELADPSALQITAFDLSPRVLQHLEAARARARTGAAYPVVLARNTDSPWSADLIEYWQRFGNWIGEDGTRVPPPPAGAGRVEVRGVAIRPPVVLSVTPADLNIVTERMEMADDDRFDLIIATNILLYYDVFEQTMASANIARMLRPGGFFLTNNRVFELPGSPLSGAGYVDVTYMSLPGVGDAGDRVIWYEKE